MLFRGWPHYVFIYRFFASWHLGKMFRGVYVGDLFPLIRHVLWWIQGLLEKGGGNGEGVNPLVFLCSSLFSTFSLSLSLQLPPSFIFGNISFSWVRPVMLTKARCSELSLPSPLCTSLLFVILRRAGGNGALQLCLRYETWMLCVFCTFSSQCSQRWHLMDGYACKQWLKGHWKGDTRHRLTWDCEFKTRYIHAPSTKSMWWCNHISRIHLNLSRCRDGRVD